jgi:hypothetical protein
LKICDCCRPLIPTNAEHPARRVASYTTRDAKEIAKLLAMVSFLCFIAHKSMGL